jgi:hypothetical protein
MRDLIEVKSNLVLTIRERGKIKTRHAGHNIWLNLGREYLTQLIAYSSFSPPTAYRNDRIQYIGMGIGGNQQTSLSVANNPPITPAYAGSNLQTDVDPTVTTLERPVRVSGTSTSPPYDPSDIWLGQIQAPPTFPIATSVTFSRLFTTSDISYSPFVQVPLSEVALYTAAANPNVYNNTAIAFDTFPTITKTSAFSLEIDWTISF